MAVRLEQSVTSKHPAWMVGARSAAPSPVGCSQVSREQGDGVGRVGGHWCPPKGRTDASDTQPAVWLPSRLLRFLSVSLPVWPKRPVPQQPYAVSNVSQPSPGEQPRRQVPINSLAWPSPRSGSVRPTDRAPGQRLSRCQPRGRSRHEGPQERRALRGLSGEPLGPPDPRSWPADESGPPRNGAPGKTGARLRHVRQTK